MLFTAKSFKQRNLNSLKKNLLEFAHLSSASSAFLCTLGLSLGLMMPIAEAAENTVLQPAVTQAVASPTSDAQKVACKVDNPFPRFGETFQYEGECKDGIANGKGKTYWFVAGSLKEVNEGNYINGKLEGLCDLRLINTQGNYRGECHEGVANGQGTMMYPDGNTYTGTFVNGKAKK